MPALAAPFQVTASTPATKVVAVTPSNTVDLANYAKALLVTAAGNVEIIAVSDADDASVTLAVVVGQLLPICVRRVRAAGTTATVYALYD